MRRVIFEMSAAAVAVVAGCGERVDDGCPAARGSGSPAVAPGDFALSVREVSYLSPWARIAIEPDGSFRGRGRGGVLWMCEGVLTAAEAAAIADAVEQAEVFDRGSNPQACFDHIEFEVAITGVAGESAARENALRYEVCNNDCPAFRAFIDAALAPATRASEAGGCTGCPDDLQANECYGSFGDPVVCRGGETHPCTAGSDEVVDCGQDDPSLQCDGEGAWVPAVVWSVEQASLRRWFQEGRWLAELTLDLAFDNRGTSRQDRSVVFDLARILGDDGETIDLPTARTVAPGTAPRERGEGFVETFVAVVPAGHPLLTVVAPSIQIPERPWSGSPLLPPVSITVVDGPP